MLGTLWQFTISTLLAQATPEGSPALTGPSRPTGATGAAAESSGAGAVERAAARSKEAIAEAKTFAEQVADWFRDHAPGVLYAILIFAVAWVLAGWVRRTIRRAAERARIDPTLGRFFANLARWVIVALAIVTSLNQVGIASTSFAALIGAAGLAIGLGFQGSLAHFASGVMLLVFRPFKVGDMVVIAGQAGRVNEIDLLITELDTADGRRVIIPNGQIFGAIIENTSHHPRRRADVAVPVPMTIGADRTRMLLERAAVSVRPRLDSEPIEVSPLDFVGPNLVWAVRVWTTREDFGATRDTLVRAVKLAVDEATLPPLAAPPAPMGAPPPGVR
jgi:small conductance mechanosensitive channel